MLAPTANRVFEQWLITQCPWECYGDRCGMRWRSIVPLLSTFDSSTIRQQSTVIRGEGRLQDASHRSLKDQGSPCGEKSLRDVTASTGHATQTRRVPRKDHPDSESLYCNRFESFTPSSLLSMSTPSSEPQALELMPSHCFFSLCRSMCPNGL